MSICETKASFIAISRHRIQTDGDGVTTLCGFYGCPLRCKYCINPQSFGEKTKKLELSPAELYERVKIDDLYFVATKGGITFGGGEPLLYPDFITEFRKFCGDSWAINLETSLNVSGEAIKKAAGAVNRFFVDIKDMNCEIYKNYTGKSNGSVIENLKLLISLVPRENIVIRIPIIKDFNSEADRENSVRILKEMGFINFDLFEYKIKNK